MCGIFPASPHTNLMTRAPPFQYPTSTVRLPSLPFMLHVSSLCQLYPAFCRQSNLTEIRSLWHGRSQYQGSLFMFYFFPGMGQWLREGPEKKLQWARDWGKKCLHNFNCFATTLFLDEPPWGERSRLYWGWEFVTLIMPWTTWLCSSWNFQQGKKNVVFITVSLRDLYWGWDH